MAAKKSAQKLQPALPNGILQSSQNQSRPVHIVAVKYYKNWIQNQPKFIQHWLQQSNFTPAPGSWSLLPGDKGGFYGAVVTFHELSVWTAAGLPMALPSGVYHFADTSFITKSELTDLCLGWSLGSYQFTRYKKPGKIPAQLIAPKNIDAAKLSASAQAIYLIRDMVNTPAEDMNPNAIASIAVNLGKHHGGKVRVIEGDDLLHQNYPLIHAVGRAAAFAPRLIDLNWGNPKHPELVLVGKGVCFDTGGLDIKSDSNMLIMKKDMGGAAHALGLAHMIMQSKLKVRLRVLIAAVENSISGNAFRPLDVIPSRKGTTVEIGNTDAEGRLVMADCLWEGSQSAPDLMIDFSTLTGAARTALGPELPALFSNNDELLVKAVHAGRDEEDPMWPMPLWKNYRPMLDSKIADINNTGSSPFAGAITAALFLNEFVAPKTPWIHLDLYAWNPNDKPGRPYGGEAMTIRGLFSLLQARYKNV